MRIDRCESDGKLASGQSTQPFVKGTHAQSVSSGKNGQPDKVFHQVQRRRNSGNSDSVEVLLQYEDESSHEPTRPSQNIGR